MKDFLKYVLATVVGIFLLGVIMTVISTLTLVGMIASSNTEQTVKKNSVFVLKLNTSIDERVSENPFASFMGGSDNESIGLDDILSAIKKAKENENIKGIYLEISQNIGMAPATATAIRRALTDFKKSGKFIISYGDGYTQGGYYVASVADKLLLNSEGMIDWKGISGQVLYYKDLLDKLGIKTQVFKVGTYKSAVEPNILNEMSEANREQIASYTNSIWKEMITAISSSRKISADSLNAYADRCLTLTDPTTYIRLKMADKLVYSEEIGQIIKKQMKLDEDEDYHTLYLSEMGNVKNEPNKHKDGEIAVYYAFGGIQQSNGSFSTDEVIDQNKVCKDLRRLRDDDEVKAVVFRVNSPGGSAFDSEQIWKDVVELKKKKPVVVSMGDYAASGGYYISCAASYIFAEATTLTGSIGIFGMFPDASELLNEKLGVHNEVVNTHAHSDFFTNNLVFKPMDEFGQAQMQKYVNRGYELFTKRCADGRKMKQDDIKKIAEGRVWTGKQALKLGLVDELGGLDAAIAKAQKLAKAEDCSIAAYPAKPSLLDNLMNTVSGDSYIEDRMKQTLGSYYPILKAMQQAGNTTGIQTALPYTLILNF